MNATAYRRHGRTAHATTMLQKPTICIIGSGAVGGYYGARLAQHGNNVHFLLRSDYDAVRAGGWNIKSCHGDFQLAPGSFGLARAPREIPKAGLAPVTLKTTTNHQFPALSGPLPNEATASLT